ncbi:MAG: Gfo/Idh/MocA family oxidoreductase [Oligoflexia bacterium]|nr:Gfo/Idh/MocA family oxidoreductase [Oligoflexia bacterium]
MRQKNFAIVGVGGFVAPRHLKAISATGNRIVAATDPNDSVGVLDQFSFDIDYFVEIERFDRHLEMLRRRNSPRKIDYLTVCSPNYLHDAHCRLGLRAEADVICEKPLVINPWNLDLLAEVERESGKRIHSILQLRLHPKLIELRNELQRVESKTKHLVDLTYITGRGHWYDYSWKGQHEKSGGVATNIGIHFFDLLIWLFGGVQSYKVYYGDAHSISGSLELRSAVVRWFLSVDAQHLPQSAKSGMTTFRSIALDGKEVEFSDGFVDLHTRVYEELLAGRGFAIEDARPSIELVHSIRHARPSPLDDAAHPSVVKMQGKL